MEDVPRIKKLLQHQSDFMAYLVAITRNIQAAEEIFQNVAVVVMETPDEKPIADFRAWAKEVVRRQALHYMRKQVQEERRYLRTESMLVEQITQVFLQDETTEEARQQELIALQTCIGQTSQQQQQMLKFRYTEKLSFAEIGNRQQKTAGAVQRALSRLRKQLHDCVDAKLRISGVRS